MNDLWKALAHLYPAAQPGVDYEIRDDGAGPYIHAWRLAAAQPSAAELQAAILAYNAARLQEQEDAAALRTLVLQLAQSAVGVRVDMLTAAQVRALFAILLAKEGALDRTGVVRPLAQWARLEG